MTHPIESAFRYHRATTESLGDEGDRSLCFAEAEGYYRTGAQGLRLPEIPQQLRELSRLGMVDRAGRKALRTSAQSRTGRIFCRFRLTGLHAGV